MASANISTPHRAPDDFVTLTPGGMQDVETGDEANVPAKKRLRKLRWWVIALVTTVILGGVGVGVFLSLGKTSSNVTETAPPPPSPTKAPEVRECPDLTGVSR